MDVFFGDTIERTAQHIIGQAWKKQTAEAMREAATKLEGIRALLTFARCAGEDAFRLNNEILRCQTVADTLESKGGL